MGIFSRFHDVFAKIMKNEPFSVANVTAERVKFRANVSGDIITNAVVIPEGTVVTIINQNNEIIEQLLERETELLEEANFKLGVIRAQKAELAEMRVLIDEMDTILNRHSEHTGWCGSDLEKQAFKAARG